ncbi:MAG: YIP1 family protein [Nanoarchaeota archaeon]
MDIIQGIKRAIGIITLNSAVIKETSRDKNATGVTLLIWMFIPVAASIGTWSLRNIIPGIFVWTAVLGIGTAIYHILAQILGGKATYQQLLRPLGHQGVLYWVMIIPGIGPALSVVAMFWSIVIDIVTLKIVYKLSTARAAAVVLIPASIIITLVATFFAVIVAFMLAMIGKNI